MRFDYGAIIPWVSHAPDDATELHIVAGPDRLTLRTPIAVRGEDVQTVGEFDVAAGEQVAFALSTAPRISTPPAPLDAAAALADTENTGTSGRALRRTTARGARPWCAR